MARLIFKNHIVRLQVVVKVAFGVYVLKSLANVIHNQFPLITAEEILFTCSSVNRNTRVFVAKKLQYNTAWCRLCLNAEKKW